jgi:tartrate-resistant acid phosphatase type 5
MITYIYAFALIVPAFTNSCSDLQRHLGLVFPSGSYVKKGVCHGLFWKSARGTGEICVHTTATRDVCPSTFPVYVSEAETILGITGSNSPAPTTISTTIAAVARVAAVTTTISPEPDSRSPLYEILAFGDWGFQGRQHVLTPTSRLITSRYTDIDAVFLLGDNFYPSGISRDLGTDDPAFNLFRTILAPSTRVNFYPVLGNHDHLGSVDAQIGFSHPQWVFPARYYFQRLAGREGLQICAWFLDTDEELFDATQSAWLDSSIATEKGACDWLVVSGHHPIYDAGQYRPNEYLIAHLLPIINRHRVNLYLSGHEHQSQVHFDGTTTFVISGATGEVRDRSSTGGEFLIYINTREVAILRLKFFADIAEFEFVGTHLRGAPVIHSGVVRKHLSLEG